MCVRLPWCAGIHVVTTLESFRGRGLGTRMTLETMRWAKARGAATAILEATRAGEPVYRRLGFREYVRLDICLRAK
jgi:GNAT superfamily N-acetyltransferase